MDYARLKSVTQFLRSHCELKKPLFLTLLLLAGVYNVSIAIPIQTEIAQQTRKVSGTVISKEDNMSVVGATVLVEGTSIGAITDINGKFTLSNVPADAKKLKVSFVGLVTQTLPIQPDMTIIMESETQMMDEVIVVAYGTSKKSSFTGSASLIKADKLEAKPVTAITNALVGATPGVQVTTANGQPGSTPSIYIIAVR